MRKRAGVGSGPNVEDRDSLVIIRRNWNARRVCGLLCDAGCLGGLTHAAFADFNPHRVLAERARKLCRVLGALRASRLEFHHRLLTDTDRFRQHNLRHPQRFACTFDTRSNAAHA